MEESYRFINGSIAVELVSPGVFILWLNRPATGNAMSNMFWPDLSSAIRHLTTEEDTRAVVLAAKGKHFSVGLDLKTFNFSNMHGGSKDVGRRFLHFQKEIRKMQNSFTSLQEANFPVIAAIHGACIGGAVDLICAADIRICNETAVFSVFEVNLGIPADLGTLQRLPKIIGSGSFCREIALTGRKFGGKQAHEHGLCSVLVSGENVHVLERAIQMATEIASKSPVAIAAVKQSLNFSIDHSVHEGLDHIANLNGSILQSRDVLSKAPFSRL